MNYLKSEPFSAPTSSPEAAESFDATFVQARQVCPNGCNPHAVFRNGAWHCARCKELLVEVRRDTDPG